MMYVYRMGVGHPPVCLVLVIRVFLGTNELGGHDLREDPFRSFIISGRYMRGEEIRSLRQFPGWVLSHYALLD